MKKCPVCRKKKSGYPVQAQGFWERWFVAVLLFRPYRCVWCGKKSQRFGFQTRQLATPGMNDGEKQPFFDFFPPEDGKALPEVLREIREAERNMSELAGASENVTADEEKTAEEKTSDIWKVI